MMVKNMMTDWYGREGGNKGLWNSLGGRALVE